MSNDTSLDFCTYGAYYPLALCSTIDQQGGFCISNSTFSIQQKDADLGNAYFPFTARSVYTAPGIDIRRSFTSNALVRFVLGSKCVNPSDWVNVASALFGGSVFCVSGNEFPYLQMRSVVILQATCDSAPRFQRVYSYNASWSPCFPTGLYCPPSPPSIAP